MLRFTVMMLRLLHQRIEVEFFFHAVGEAGHHGEDFPLFVADFYVAIG